MVAKLRLPVNCSLGTLNQVVNERRQYGPLQLFYDSIKPELDAQFNLYLKVGGNPETIKPLDLSLFTLNQATPEQRKQTLINLYSPKIHQIPYEILYEMRKNHGLLCCPCCGEDGAPGTLDHYLPKDIFPEFSVCLANLTPMCNRCQEEKSTEYLTSSNKKAYIHPYFDRVIDSYFDVDIIPPYNTPTFEVRIVRGEPHIMRLLISHVIGINFQNRFKEFCRSKHIHLLRLMLKRREQNMPYTVEQLINFYLMPELEKSLNAWPVIYYQSVLNNPKFLQYLDKGILPNRI